MALHHRKLDSLQQFLSYTSRFYGLVILTEISQIRKWKALDTHSRLLYAVSILLPLSWIIWRTRAATYYICGGTGLIGPYNFCPFEIVYQCVHLRLNGTNETKTSNKEMKRIENVKKACLFKNVEPSNSGISQLSGCHRKPSQEKSIRSVNLQAHISDNHCLQPKPEYRGHLLSATHFPLAQLQPVIRPLDANQNVNIRNLEVKSNTVKYKCLGFCFICLIILNSIQSVSALFPFVNTCGDCRTHKYQNLVFRFHS